ncbi:hypothetical protein AX17_005273 [Amanita inopinata Kibby_2008]|nr:hypothetical protein AX17_005273 [Amanita inopinata Kibby_2008]
MLFRIRPDAKDHVASAIALPLLFGFIFMLAMDRLVSPHARMKTLSQDVKYPHLPTHGVPHDAQPESRIDFDAELSELEREQGSGRDHESASASNGSVRHVPVAGSDAALARKHAASLTFGLVVHALVDGLVLGVSSLSSAVSVALSIVVFMALVVHKAPTALALASSLLSVGLPREECRKHLAFFAAATPAGALASYFLFSSFNIRPECTAVALLASSGTFLYVATVLQPPSQNTNVIGEMKPTTRTVYSVSGILLPFMLSAIIAPQH